MKLFLSTYYNKVDNKGRTSVPAAFRDILTVNNMTELIANKSLLNDCIEVSSVSRIESLNKNIEMIDSLSLELRDAMLMVLLGNSISLSFDSDGRMTIPKKMLLEVNITSQVVFVGKGRKFEIWNPNKFEKYKKKVMEIITEEKVDSFFKE